MTKKMTAPAENQQDFLMSLLTGLARFCKKNKQGVLTAVVVLVLAAGIGFFYSAHTKKVSQESWAAYYAAYVQLASGNEAEAFSALDALNTAYANTPAAQYGQLFKADALFRNENYAQAQDVYKPLLISKNETVRTVAALSLAAAQQAAKDYKAATDGMNEFIKNNPTSFALPQAYLTLAMSQELAGNKAEAVGAYKHLAESYANTYFGVLAKDKLKTLQK